MLRDINMFIIYAREDKDIKLRLLQHLNPFKNIFKLNIWHDDYIEPGRQWKPHIESRLNQTDIFILLVSIDFMNSEFINQVEFKFAIDRYKENKSVLIPVLINYCQWDIDFYFKDYTFNLNELQILPDQAKPIGDWKTPEQALNNIAAGIRKVLVSIKSDFEQIELSEQNKKTSAIDNEKSLWQEAFNQDTIEGFESYLFKYPNGKQKKDILDRIMYLKNNEEQTLWKNACDQNTILSYENYLKETSLKLNLEEANKRIDNIRKENKDKESEKITSQDFKDEFSINSYKIPPIDIYKDSEIEDIRNENPIDTKQNKELGQILENQITKKRAARKYFLIGVGSSALFFGIIGLIILSSNNSKNIKNSNSIQNEIDTSGLISNIYKIDTSKYISVSSEAQKILYVGLDNPISINLINIDSDKVIISCTNSLPISKVGINKYVVAPSKAGIPAIITVKTGNKLKTFEFKVKDVPNPVAEVGINKGGRMQVRDFQNQLGVSANLENFVFEGVKFNVTSYTIVLTGAGFPNLQFRNVKGNSFDSVRDLLEKLKPGTTITIDNIAAVGPGGMRYLPPIVFNLY